MLRTKGLTEKVLILGLDGLDPRFSKAMVDAGKMPNLKRLIDMGSAREDLVLLGAMPTIHTSNVGHIGHRLLSNDAWYYRLQPAGSWRIWI